MKEFPFKMLPVKQVIKCRYVSLLYRKNEFIHQTPKTENKNKTINPSPCLPRDPDILCLAESLYLDFHFYWQRFSCHCQPQCHWPGSHSLLAPAPPQPGPAASPQPLPQGCKTGFKKYKSCTCVLCLTSAPCHWTAWPVCCCTARVGAPGSWV